MLKKIAILSILSFVSCGSDKKKEDKKVVQEGESCKVEQEDTRECEIENGQGSQFRGCSEGIWQEWSKCIPSKCDNGFSISVDKCEPRQGGVQVKKISYVSGRDTAGDRRCHDIEMEGSGQLFHEFVENFSDNATSGKRVVENCSVLDWVVMGCKMSLLDSASYGVINLTRYDVIFWYERDLKANCESNGGIAVYRDPLTGERTEW